MFLLNSDASSVGLGAVISQMQDGKEVVIAYASRSLSNAERNYDTTKREFLAVTFGLRTFDSICWDGNLPSASTTQPCSGCARHLSPWHGWPDGWRMSSSLISRSSTGPELNTAMPTDCRVLRRIKMQFGRLNSRMAIRLWMI